MRLAVLLKHGFEEIEALTMVDYLRRGGVDVDMVSCEEEQLLEGGHGISIQSDLSFTEMNPEQYAAIYLPGGPKGAERLAADAQVLSLLQDWNQKNRWIFAMCAAPMVLEKADILTGRQITCYPGYEVHTSSAEHCMDVPVVQDAHFLTSRGPATAIDLALKALEVLQGKEKSDAIAQQIQWTFRLESESKQ